MNTPPPLPSTEEAQKKRGIFSFRDLKYLYFWQSVWFLFMRTFSAGLTVTILGVIGTLIEGTFDAQILLAPFVWIFMMLFVFTPMIVISVLIEKFFSIMKLAVGSPAELVGNLTGLFLRIPATILAVTIGDPLIWILHKFKPNWVPIDNPPFMSLIFLWGIFDPNKVAVSR